MNKKQKLSKGNKVPVAKSTETVLEFLGHSSMELEAIIHVEEMIGKCRELNFGDYDSFIHTLCGWIKSNVDILGYDASYMALLEVMQLLETIMESNEDRFPIETIIQSVIKLNDLGFDYTYRYGFFEKILNQWRRLAA